MWRFFFELFFSLHRKDNEINTLRWALRFIRRRLRTLWTGYHFPPAFISRAIYGEGARGEVNIGLLYWDRSQFVVDAHGEARGRRGNGVVDRRSRSACAQLCIVLDVVARYDGGRGEWGGYPALPQSPRGKWFSKRSHWTNQYHPRSEWRSNIAW